MLAQINTRVNFVKPLLQRAVQSPRNTSVFFIYLFCFLLVVTCNPSPCMNGGSCFLTNGGTSFQCVCPSGFSGQRCETSINSTKKTTISRECRTNENVISHFRKIIAPVNHVETVQPVCKHRLPLIANVQRVIVVVNVKFSQHLPVNFFEKL